MRNLYFILIFFIIVYDVLAQKVIDQKPAPSIVITMDDLKPYSESAASEKFTEIIFILNELNMIYKANPTKRTGSNTVSDDNLSTSTEIKYYQNVDSWVELISPALVLYNTMNQTRGRKLLYNYPTMLHAISGAAAFLMSIDPNALDITLSKDKFEIDYADKWVNAYIEIITTMDSAGEQTNDIVSDKIEDLFKSRDFPRTPNLIALRKSFNDKILYYENILEKQRKEQEEQARLNRLEEIERQRATQATIQTQIERQRAEYERRQAIAAESAARAEWAQAWALDQLTRY